MFSGSGERWHADATVYRQTSPASEGLAEVLLVGVPLMIFTILKGLWWLTRRYPLPVAVVAAFGVAQWFGVAGELAVGLTVVGFAALVVRLRCRSWWGQRITRPRARWRTKTWLKRNWSVLCDRVGLTVTDRDRGTGDITESHPALSGLSWADHGTLQGRIDLVPGQLVDDLGEVGERLAEAARAHQCRIRRTSPGVAELSLLFGDPLVEVIPPLPVAQTPDLAALPVGMREDGKPWLLRLQGTHVLVAGVTGAGKGSVVWSMLRALAPAIHAGTVQVWAVDGKAGMELAPGKGLFTQLATSVEAGVELLELAVQRMTERATRLAGQYRLHAPTEEEPLLLVLVDEVALLTAYQPDRKLRERAERALATLATQGRAPGVVLVAALQDPRKEVLGLRKLFPTKIGMRLDEKTQVDMVLGDGARDAGALCHKIPDDLAGVAYVKLDGLREPVRVRASYLNDADIAVLAAQYRAPGAWSAPLTVVSVQKSA
jgi:DNA segregation ATPase FtsK/SpoIIIE, S-DNA-T family